MGTHEKIEQPSEPQTADEFLNEIHIDVMARTLWGEARSEGVKGIEAVAHVILNRVAIADRNGGRYWWGHDVTTVCQRPYQFSCWNHDDPNRARIIKLDISDIHFATAMRIARRAVYGQLGKDPTGGATHYHTLDIMPAWAQGETPTVIIGRHTFYNLKGA